MASVQQQLGHLEEAAKLLRAYLRHRAELIAHRAPHILHLQKALHQMNIQLDRVLADITGQDASAQPRQKRDYREAAAQFDMVRRSGTPVDPVVCEYAAKGQFEETVAALSALCQTPSKLVEAS